MVWSRVGIIKEWDLSSDNNTIIIGWEIISGASGEVFVGGGDRDNDTFIYRRVVVG